MTLIALGLNHQTAPVALRERVAFAGDAFAPALAALRALPQVDEVALLSTCNRTEVYAIGDDAAPAIAEWLATHAAESTDLHAYLYRHGESAAARHLFRVAAGLDSLVLGEPQILGQVKEAWSLAREHGAMGPQLDRLFQQAFATAKRARSDTAIGANPVSVASAAVKLARDSFARPQDSTVLLIGAGETIELAARHLVQANVRRLLIANRTLAHAQALATAHGGYALALDELDRHLAEADIVFSATASQTPILHRAQVEAALAARRHRHNNKPVLLVDLAVPRDIAADVAELRDVFVYTIDDLHRAVEDNRRSRKDAADAAETIIDLQVARYMEVAGAAFGMDGVRAVRAHGQRLSADALTRAKQQLAAGQSPDAVLDQLAHTLTNRLLHAPTVAVRDAALRGDAELLRAAARMFPDHNDSSDDAAEPAPQA
ncbi:glutamyl-tRNA reductase [Solilutibacter silvestris]|uniref:Glutamyl-tRNA reductase n=1 Tax=Solilutibacter silvestris TaxID=1645665 RepID=A0A2K1PXP3_9GAMM|nr:glutamyl-tRNA reductase [Lysobacter silvestris]PNS07553.1 hemA: glutamyl-tRNA reductase [Lysobacter silvestris]